MSAFEIAGIVLLALLAVTGAAWGWALRGWRQRDAQSGKAKSV